MDEEEDRGRRRVFWEVNVELVLGLILRLAIV